MNNEKKTFKYSYHALTEREKLEVESIKNFYTDTKKESAYHKILAIDSKVKSTATIWALVLGVVGILIFGLGLTMILEWNIWLWGIILMIISIPPISIAYPVYGYLIKKGKIKYKDEIIALSDSLLNK